MLAIAVSVLFALAAFAAFTVIHASWVTGSRRARAILAELAEIEREARVTRGPARPRPWAIHRPALAAA